MLLSVHVTSVLFLVWFNNFARLQAFIGITRSYSSRPLSCALVLYIKTASVGKYTLFHLGI